MKVLKFLGLTLLTIIVLYVIIAALSSKNITVERTYEVSQSPDEVFAVVNDFNHYQAWNAWSRIDSNQTYEITGSGTAIGDKWTWKSDHPQVGNGGMEHKEAVPGEYIYNEMTFEGMGSSKDIWQFEATEDGGTKITWKAEMDAPFIVRPFFGTMMEAAVGPQFDASLENLSEHLEKMEWKGFGEEEVSPFNYIYIKTTAPVTEMGELMPKHIGALFAHLEKNKVEPAGAPMGIFYNWADTITFDVAIPVAADVRETKDIKKGMLEKGSAATFHYVGPNEESEAVHYKMDDYLKKMNHEFKGPVVEIYYKDPAVTPAEELETKIIYFIK